MAEEYADRVTLNPNTYRGDVVTAYVCGCMDVLSPVDKGEAMTAEQWFDNHSDCYTHNDIENVPAMTKETFLKYSALRKVENGINPTKWLINHFKKLQSEGEKMSWDQIIKIAELAYSEYHIPDVRKEVEMPSEEDAKAEATKRFPTTKPRNYLQEGKWLGWMWCHKWMTEQLNKID